MLPLHYSRAFFSQREEFLKGFCKPPRNGSCCGESGIVEGDVISELWERNVRR